MQSASASQLCSCDTQFIYIYTDISAVANDWSSWLLITNQSTNIWISGVSRVNDSASKSKLAKFACLEDWYDASLKFCIMSERQVSLALTMSSDTETFDDTTESCAGQVKNAHVKSHLQAEGNNNVVVLICSLNFQQIWLSGKALAETWPGLLRTSRWSCYHHETRLRCSRHTW